MNKTITLNCGYKIRIFQDENGFTFLAREDIESAVVDATKEKAPKAVDRQNRTIALLLDGKKIKNIVSLYDELGCNYRVNGSKNRMGGVHIFLALRILHDKIKDFDLTQSHELFDLIRQELQKIELDEELLMLWGATIKYHRAPSKYSNTLKSFSAMFNIPKENRLDAIRLMLILGSQEAIDIFTKK